MITSRKESVKIWVVMLLEESYFQIRHNLDVTGTELTCTVAARWLHGFLQLRSPWFLLTTKEVGTCKAGPIKTG